MIMSRSYKKHPVVKDKGRRDYNRVFRRKNRQLIHEGRQPYQRTSEVVNDWDICDWRFHAYDDLWPNNNVEEREKIFKRK